ncbi:hypothetical protein [Cohnella herbarum]|uniref:SLH domain-containing protein n=1 Tax=Cohnella herbarum TaxID=2728023 RepID=A0A7Z2ZN61_9BACL|nr:hypothetical protein [Cohnella herbarum]QJD84727.1 hypothetical protein HH215_17070 [Cohnella herbarum]
MLSGMVTMKAYATSFPDETQDFTGYTVLPKSNATRAEALQIILNVLKLNPQLKTLLDSLS